MLISSSGSGPTRRLVSLLAVTFLLALGGCATTKKTESEGPAPATTAPADVSIHDKVVIPGERAGPILLGMSLRKLIEVVGEPVSSSPSRIPHGHSALLYRYGDPDASADGQLLITVREHDQTVYSIEIDKIESFHTREGLHYGSSEALVRASFGKPQSIQESAQGEIARAYCYLNGLALYLDATGHVQGMIVYPGSDLRKICHAK